VSGRREKGRKFFPFMNEIQNTPTSRHLAWSEGKNDRREGRGMPRPSIHLPRHRVEPLPLRGERGIVLVLLHRQMAGVDGTEEVGPHLGGALSVGGRRVNERSTAIKWRSGSMGRGEAGGEKGKKGGEGKAEGRGG